MADSQQLLMATVAVALKEIGYSIKVMSVIFRSFRLVLLHKFHKPRVLVELKI